MSRYITWEDVTDRYPDAAKVGNGQANFELAYIAPAEAAIDGTFAARYVVPFCNTIGYAPSIIKDLSVDLAYYRAVGIRSKFQKTIAADISSRMGLYNGGPGRIMSDSGTIMPTNTSGIINTAVDQGYAPSFGMDDPVGWTVSSDWQDFYGQEHGLVGNGL